MDKTLSTSGRLKIYIHEGRNIGIYFLPQTCDIALGCFIKVNGRDTQILFGGTIR